MFQNKTEKKNIKRLSFIRTQFKIEFLLPFTGCRKVLEKVSDVQNYRVVSILPNLSKIYVRCLYDQMYKYFNLILSK